MGGDPPPQKKNRPPGNPESGLLYTALQAKSSNHTEKYAGIPLFVSFVNAGLPIKSSKPPRVKSVLHRLKKVTLVVRRGPGGCSGVQKQDPGMYSNQSTAWMLRKIGYQQII